MIRYLEFCINEMKNKDQAIHNYLLSLYAKLKPDSMMDYLLEQDKVSYALVFGGATLNPFPNDKF